MRFREGIKSHWYFAQKFACAVFSCTFLCFDYKILATNSRHCQVKTERRKLLHSSLSSSPSVLSLALLNIS